MGMFYTCNKEYSNANTFIIVIWADLNVKAKRISHSEKKNKRFILYEVKGLPF